MQARAPGGAAASRAHAPPVRPHTPEQAAIVRAIKAATDYYGVLGVAKDASAEDIKRVRSGGGVGRQACSITFKSQLPPPLSPSPASTPQAYRKQAQKVHPDKNPAPGSEEVFKRESSLGASMSLVLLL